MLDDPRAKARALWDEMAPGWERNREYMWQATSHVSQWLLDRLEARPGDTILDLAGGPGDNGFLAAETVGPSGRVIETDFAPEMVKAAARRVDELGLSNVETRVLDAESMDLADKSVDGIICRWGFMLMINPPAALRECRRVLKPDRRLAFSVWGGPQKNPWITVVGMTMAQLGYQPGGDPFAAGGIFSLADHEKLRNLLKETGFAPIRIEEMRVDWSHGSFDEAWQFMTEVAGPLAASVKRLPSEEIDKVRSVLEENTQAFRDESGINLPGVSINVTAS